LRDASIDGQKVSEHVQAAISKLGENVVVKRAARLQVDGGVVGGYVHAGGKLGVLVGLDTAGADSLAKDVAMHVAAADPTPVSVDRDGVDAGLLEDERTLYRRQAEQEGKPEKMLDRIVEGKINKFLSEVCLVEQSFVKDPDRSVGELLGEVKVRSFERFKLGQAIDE
jgi:elongation factor Ts